MFVVKREEVFVSIFHSLLHGKNQQFVAIDPAKAWFTFSIVNDDFRIVVQL